MHVMDVPYVIYGLCSVSCCTIMVHIGMKVKWVNVGDGFLASFHPQLLNPPILNKCMLQINAKCSTSFATA